MEISIKGSPEDITKLLQTIASSQEQDKNIEITIDAKKFSQRLSSSIGKTCSKTS